MKLIALKKLGRTLPGHIFDIRDKEARALIALKIAEPYTSDLVDPAAAMDAPRQKRQYRRRDLTAIT